MKVILFNRKTEENVYLQKVKFLSVHENAIIVDNKSYSRDSHSIITAEQEKDFDIDDWCERMNK